MCGRGSPHAASLLTLSLAWSDRSNPSKCAVRTTAEPTTNVRVSVCGEGPGDGEAGQRLLFPDPPPWPDVSPHPALPLLPQDPRLRAPQKTSEEEKTEGRDFLSRKFPANQPPRFLLAAHALCADGRVLTAQLASLDNTVKTLQPGGKSIPFQKQERSLKA